MPQNDELSKFLGYTDSRDIKSQRDTYSAEVVDNSTDAYKRLQQGDKSAASVVLKELQPTIDKAIQNYASGDSAYKTQAYILALDAAKTYDPERGASLSTHVTNNLKRLQRLSAQRGNLTKVSENASIERQQIQRATREWIADKGTDPTVEDLASVTGLSRKRIDAVMNNKAVVPDSLIATPEGENLVQSPDSQKAIDLYTHAIYDELDNTDKKIYEWITGYGKGEKLPSKEIARRLNISPAAVSQRLNRISQKFAEGRAVVEASVYGV